MSVWYEHETTQPCDKYHIPCTGDVAVNDLIHFIEPVFAKFRNRFRGYRHVEAYVHDAVYDPESRLYTFKLFVAAEGCGPKPHQVGQTIKRTEDVVYRHLCFRAHNVSEIERPKGLADRHRQRLATHFAKFDADRDLLRF